MLDGGKQCQPSCIGEGEERSERVAIEAGQAKKSQIWTAETGSILYPVFERINCEKLNIIHQNISRKEFTV